jgi:4-hydroxy-2-oxoheptanedioate aldolase
MEHLIKELTKLSTSYQIIGMKQSFEDEGVLLNDVITIKRITELCGLQSFVKIGGCEAKTDLHNCVNLGVNGVIAPMIESPFALSKFLNVVSNYPKSTNPYIVIESKTAYDNINSILKESSPLTGIVVGRSDFAKSYGLDKTQVDSDFILQKVEDILTKAKHYNLVTTMGGNVSVQSSNFIKEMFNKGLLDRIETRNIVIELNSENVNNIHTIIQKSLDFEINWIKYKLDQFTFLTEEYSSRVKLLSKRK